MLSVVSGGTPAMEFVGEAVRRFSMTGFQRWVGGLTHVHSRLGYKLTYHEGHANASQIEECATAKVDLAHIDPLLAPL